ncbi:MAG: NAD(+) synthase [Thermaurantimonas sp.]
MNAERVATYITQWLKDYAQSAGSKGFVVGVSGGVDSAAVSALCSRTGLDVLVLTMPIHQAADQLKRANNHMNWLRERFPNVRCHSVDLTDVFDALVNALNADPSESLTSLSLANTRSRLRMVTLYYHAQLYGLLVAGTGNKVEDFGVGFYTKYGDGGVDLSPIADLMKSEVYELARYLGINSEILEADPTDGLWHDNRTDEQQLGATYDQMEWAMKMSEKGLKADDFEGEQKRWMEIYESHHRRNRHKMIPIPVCKIPEEIKNTQNT